jgi:hypothetical protein
VTSDGIPADVEQFVARHVHSVEQLEILLLLRATRSRAWTAAQLVRELRIDLGSAQSRLKDLHTRGLVEPTAPESEAFSFAPASPAIDAAVAALARTYIERRVTLINLIFSKPVQQIQSFADAFRLRKGD